MTADVLHLPAWGLLSKWGFNDGDTPECVMDYCDAQGLPYPEDWHATLIRLVRAYLLPALDQRVEVTEVDTCHNPIRALTVDGVDVTDCWFHDKPRPLLTPAGVDVPLGVIASAV